MDDFVYLFFKFRIRAPVTSLRQPKIDQRVPEAWEEEEEEETAAACMGSRSCKWESAETQDYYYFFFWFFVFCLTYFSPLPFAGCFCCDFLCVFVLVIHSCISQQRKLESACR